MADRVYSTKLSALCDGVIEMGWLAAVITTPLFVNPHSVRTFNPDKVTVLRSITLVMVFAWILEQIEERMVSRNRPDATWRRPFMVATLFLALVYLLSTALSLHPWISFWGSYGRLQGTAAILSYVTLFWMIVQGLRTRAQLGRLVTVVVLVSLPVALYAVFQRHGLDPLVWQLEINRVSGHLGNPIFLAAYLGMVFPLTLARLFTEVKTVLAGAQSRKAHLLGAGSYLAIALLQLLAIWYAGSRGPLLGLAASSLFFLLLLAMTWRSRAGAISVVTLLLLAVVVIGLILVVVVASSADPLSASVPGLGRLGNAFSFARILYWQGMVRLLEPHGPLIYPDGHTDALNPVRWLVGYGPETLRIAYPRFRLPLLWRYEPTMLDRAHNETFDALVNTGLLGLAAYLVLFISLFYHGLQGLGLLQTRGRRVQLLVLLVACPILGVAFTWWAEGAYLAGIALAMGLVAGLTIFVSATALLRALARLAQPTPPPPRRIDLDRRTQRRGRNHRRKPAPPAILPENPEQADTGTELPYPVLTVAAFSAIVGHFVEINYGIAIAPTSTLFWVCAGLLVVTASKLITPPGEQEPAQRRTEKAGTRQAGLHDSLAANRWPALSAALLGGLVLATVAYGFVLNYAGLKNPALIVWRAFTTLPAEQGRTSYAILMLILCTWLVAGVLLLAHAASGTRVTSAAAHRVETGRSFLLYLPLSLAMALLFALVIAAQQLISQDSALENQIGLAERVASQITLYYGLVAAVLLLGAFVLGRGRSGPQKTATTWGAAAALPLLIATIYLIAQFNLRPIQLDMLSKQAGGYETEGRWEAADILHRRTVQQAPSQDWYYTALGGMYQRLAATVADPLNQERALQQAEQALTRR